ncbi:oligogalacturonate-specific porin KdgM family protein [Pseudomonas duriflava]|uniref:oligogalacturonate-specific porin KdgM family protein n=1 Tax=Pseudomonas duriflava TaxID=459528 RepID=UPI003CC8093F
MIKTIAVASSLSVAVLAGNTQAADYGYINYRHQYIDDAQLHSDRVLLGIRLENGLGFEGELKYKTGGSRKNVAFDNTVGDGHEFTADYRYSLSPQWTIAPFIGLVAVENATTYRAGTRLGYKINNQFTVSGRYRYEYRKLDRDQIDPDVADRAKQDQHVHRFDTWLGYTPGGAWSYEYNYVFFKADYTRYNGKKTDYEQNLAFKYKWDKRWQPYFEVGDIKVNATESDRQMRFRVGVHYSF